MSTTNRELADFLRRARSHGDPARSGLPADSRVRRVPGLRREEVALLAGVSTDYYSRLEQGRPISPSPAVVEAIATALELDTAGRIHLQDLIGPTPLRNIRHAPTVQRVRPTLHQFLDTLDGHPAFILGRRTDVLASNAMARALLTDFDQLRPRQRNYVRWMFLGEEPRSLYADWETQARAAVESLRLDVGNHPEDPIAAELIAELTELSSDFADWWEQHRVYQRTYGTKQLQHPVVGALTITYDTLALPGDPDQTLFVYTAQAGTSAQQAMNILASWALPGRGDDRRVRQPDRRGELP